VGSGIAWEFLPESAVTPRLEGEIRSVLVAALPEHADFFTTASYRGSVPEFRLVGRSSGGRLVAHLGCGRREALAGAQPVRILGIGAVAVHPDMQRQGVGRWMFEVLRQESVARGLADWGFLECRERVAGFYEHAGFRRLDQPCTSRDHETQEWETYHGPVMILPMTKSAMEWPSGGEVNLLGMSW
jgi:GNAT superfamily N-acetyltransferase